jgi:hypothetical protein
MSREICESMQFVAIMCQRAVSVSQQVRLHYVMVTDVIRLMLFRAFLSSALDGG